ncbi:hypothetical protein BH11MYX4_BH11MYX4_47150 [soil metagenome]
MIARHVDEVGDLGGEGERLLEPWMHVQDRAGVANARARVKDVSGEDDDVAAPARLRDQGGEHRLELAREPERCLEAEVQVRHDDDPTSRAWQAERVRPVEREREAGTVQGVVGGSMGSHRRAPGSEECPDACPEDVSRRSA